MVEAAGVEPLADFFKSRLRRNLLIYQKNAKDALGVGTAITRVCGYTDGYTENRRHTHGRAEARALPPPPITILPHQLPQVESHIVLPSG